MHYDVFGDIHGHASVLEALLRNRGYQYRFGRWGHSERIALFVGDFVDRGPEQIETLMIVRGMIEAGTAFAVMGNHELNAIGYANRDSQGYLRVRGSKNTHQHRAFLEAVGVDSPLHAEWVQWMRTLPLWLDLPELRLVHACWDEQAVNSLSGALFDGNTLPEDLTPFYRKAGRHYGATEVLLKGKEIALPDGVTYLDKDGVARRNTRVRWWVPNVRTVGEAAVDDSFDEAVSNLPLESGPWGYHGDKPVFIGHYWMNGEPRILSEKVACVDFSVAKGGVLCCYGFDGETMLSDDKLEWVAADQYALVTP